MTIYDGMNLCLGFMLAKLAIGMAILALLAVVLGFLYIALSCLKSIARAAEDHDD